VRNLERITTQSVHILTFTVDWPYCTARWYLS
jgi:hypothetical protein